MPYQPATRSRLYAGVIAFAIPLGAGAALVAGLAAKFVPAIDDRLSSIAMVDLDPPKPPPPSPPPPKPEPSPEREAAEAAPPAARATPLPRVAPSPRIAIASPTPAATVAAIGRDASAGAALAGSGSGAGGQGNGFGAGGTGSGTGAGGGRGSGAVRVAGAISDRDYPRAAQEAGAAGTVGIRFLVRSDGRVSGCSVLSSSGYPDLDDLTCELVERRFRFRPATDDSGRPIDQTLRTSFTFGLRQRY